jgi:hypothetical protein
MLIVIPHCSSTPVKSVPVNWQPSVRGRIDFDEHCIHIAPPSAVSIVTRSGVQRQLSWPVGAN